MWKYHCRRVTEDDRIIRRKESYPIGGSLNFAKAAEENKAQNLFIIHFKKSTSLFARGEGLQEALGE